MGLSKFAKFLRRLADEDGAALVQPQQRRLEKVVAYARRHSPFYREIYQNLPEAGFDLADLPPITKLQLMANFNDWVTDGSVTRAGVDDFIKDKSRVGQRYLGKYYVWTTSGTTGEPGIFLVDDRSQRLYNQLVILRGYGSWMTWGGLAHMVRGGFHFAMVLADGDHYAGAATLARMRRQLSFMANSLKIFSILQPLPVLVEQLNAFQPAILVSYPSVYTLLAREQMAGRLAIHPLVLHSSGEGLDEVARQKIAAAFPASLLADSYAASEFLCISFECQEHWQHVNDDWVILEPVDEDLRPVLAGQPSVNVLLTNLVNRVAPVIRYSLGDSITLKPEPCSCGNPRPAIRVSGRTDEILSFPAAAGGTTGVLPMALAAVVEQVPGVFRYQIIQSAPNQIKVRLTVESGCDRAVIWATIEADLQKYFSAQGVAPVQTILTEEIPAAHPSSGKFRHVYKEFTA